MTSYEGRHRALKSYYGPAAEYPCAAPRCERPAHDWALVGAPTVAERVGGKVLVWSRFADDYRPLCRSHHLMLDRGGDFDHCPQGHRRADVGTIGTGCRACDRNAARERMRRRRAARQTTRTSGNHGRTATTGRGHQ